MSVITPNMNLVESAINVDSGLAWEQNLNASLTIVDGHTHTPGLGVAIPPAGLNINSALTFQNQQATNLQAVVFTNQSSLATLNALYAVSGELWYNDGTSAIQLTLNGNVNATSSGISSGTATASFVSSVLTVLAASNTPANIQGASLLLGLPVSGTNYLTLSPPAALSGGAYSLVLPAIPTATSFLTLDTSGNIAAGPTISSGLQGSNIAANTVSQANLVIKSASSSTASTGNVAISSSCGSFGSTSSSPVNVTNLSVTITTLGGPILISLIPDGTTNLSFWGGTSGGVVAAKAILLRGASQIANWFAGVAAGGEQNLPVSSIQFMDVVTAGTYIYTIQVQSAGSSTDVLVQYAVLVAYEI